MGQLDHLVYATRDLDAAVESLAQALGVRAGPGGHHPGLGTRNALLDLGAGAYLEIIGPDAGQPAPAQPRWFGIDGLAAPRLVAWAVKDAELQRRQAEAAAAGFPLGPVESGSRVTPAGVRLAWRFTHPRVLAAGGVIPFFIDWSDGSHPADLAPKGVRFVGLRAEHPEPERVLGLLHQFGVDAPVGRGLTPRLMATLDTPRGRVELT